MNAGASCGLMATAVVYALNFYALQQVQDANAQSGQTADVTFTDSKLRRIGTLHCVLAFLFNTTMLALTINVAAGLF